MVGEGWVWVDRKGSGPATFAQVFHRIKSVGTNGVIHRVVHRVIHRCKVDWGPGSTENAYSTGETSSLCVYTGAWERQDDPGDQGRLRRPLGAGGRRG